MSRKIIADTSIWIEYFKNNPGIVAFMEENLLKNKICITGIIIAELIQGVKSDKESISIGSCITAVPYLEVNYKDWIYAGKISNELRKKGITLPLTDIAIAAAAINNSFSIATLDTHFYQIPNIKIHNIDCEKT